LDAVANRFTQLACCIEHLGIVAERARFEIRRLRLVGIASVQALIMRDDFHLQHAAGRLQIDQVDIAIKQSGKFALQLEALERSHRLSIWDRQVKV
jgi:hypothetical protein